MNANTKFRVLTHDYNNVSEYWVESYNEEFDNPYNTTSSGSVVSIDFNSEVEAQEWADDCFVSRKELMKNHYKAE